MAKVLVLTDRGPNDFEWKGAFAWNLIRSLAESQHEVLVLTTEDTAEISLTHPRLTIARPASSWGVHYLPKFLQAIFLFQPEVICTVTPQAPKRWSGLSIWPYLHSACTVMQKIKRFNVIFESQDLDENRSAHMWHGGAKACVVFSSEHRRNLRTKISCPIEVSPFELDLLTEESESPQNKYIFIPAPISEWRNPPQNLQALRNFLAQNADLHAQINGGWGDWPAHERRTAWQILMPVADRLHMLEPMTLAQMINKSRNAESLWLESLKPDSWRDVVSRFVAETFNKTGPGSRPALQKGSTANFLSRLFAGTLDPWPTL
jgi:hypothetical protein